MQQKLTIFAMAFIAAASTANAKPEPQETWQIDPAHTSISFDIGHLGISTIRGAMALESGTIKTDPQDVTKSSLDIKIAVSSLNTGVTARDMHVKSEDFLEADKHPFITFKSISVRENPSDKKLLIEGDLTIKGTTKRVSLVANPISEEVRLPKEGSEKVVRATTAYTTINRYDFGVDYGKAKNPLTKMLDGGVGKDITITIHTEFFKMMPTTGTTGKKAK